MPKIPGYIKALLKLALSAGALYYVYTKVDIREVAAIFKHVNYLWLIIATLFFVVSKIISAFRLNIYFYNIGSRLTENSNLRLYLLGMYYNLFLPGGIGGDGYKVYLLNKLFLIKVKKLFWAVLLDRINGVLALFILAMVLAVFIPIPYLYKVIALVSLPIAYSIYFWVIRRFFSDFASSIHITSIYSFGVQISQIIAAICILYANNNQIHTIEYLFLFLVSSIVATLPFTIGGIGSREITFLFGAGVMHLDIHQSIALSLLFYVITAVVSLAGIYYSLNTSALNPQLQNKTSVSV